MKKKKGYTLLVVLMLIVNLIMIASLWRGYLVNDDFAVKALENHGFSNVEVVDRGVFLVGFRVVGVQVMQLSLEQKLLILLAKR